jgi:hypothetical protein
MREQLVREQRMREKPDAARVTVYNSVRAFLDSALPAW